MSTEDLLMIYLKYPEIEIIPGYIIGRNENSRFCVAFSDNGKESKRYNEPDWAEFIDARERFHRRK